MRKWMDGLPSLFQCRDLAACVVSCLPRLQYRRWIEEASEEVQTKLLEWRHDVQDQILWQTVVANRNTKGFQFLCCKSVRINWSWIYEQTESEYLQLAINSAQQKPNINNFDVHCQPLEHLKVLAKCMDIPLGIQNRLVNESIAKQDSEALHWMLNDILGSNSCKTDRLECKIVRNCSDIYFGKSSLFWFRCMHATRIIAN